MYKYFNLNIDALERTSRALVDISEPSRPTRKKLNEAIYGIQEASVGYRNNIFKINFSWKGLHVLYFRSRSYLKMFAGVLKKGRNVRKTTAM